VSTAPTSSLGTPFHNGENRRYSVGVLQKAKVDEDVDMEYHEEQPKKIEIDNNLIDPSLGAMDEEPASAETEPTAQEKEIDDLHKNAELITALRDYIKNRLVEEERKESEPQESQDDQQNADTTMNDAGQESQEAEKESQVQTDEQALYPVLKAVEAC